MTDRSEKGVNVVLDRDGTHVNVMINIIVDIVVVDVIVDVVVEHDVIVVGNVENITHQLRDRN